MRKIPREQENPIDNALIDLADKLCPLFKRLNFTPNGITTISLLFGLLSAFCLYKGRPLLFGLFYFISYFFDCMDGYYARKYEMSSKFGDMYDHIKDYVVVILILIIFFRRNCCCSPKSITIAIIIMGVTLLPMMMYFGCQEKIYNKNESPTLSYLKNLCPNT